MGVVDEIIQAAHKSTDTSAGRELIKAVVVLAHYNNSRAGLNWKASERQLKDAFIQLADKIGESRLMRKVDTTEDLSVEGYSIEVLINKAAEAVKSVSLSLFSAYDVMHVLTMHKEFKEAREQINSEDGSSGVRPVSIF